jgi:hypothetical protein
MSTVKAVFRGVLAGAALCALTALGWWMFLANAELEDKAVYTALQNIEYDYRGRHLTPIFIQSGGDAGEVLGLDTKNSSFPYFWISTTKVKMGGEVLAVSDTDIIATSCSEIGKALAGHSVKPTVRRFLNERCARP